MKILFRLRMLVLFAAILTAIAMKSDAQSLGLSVTASADSVAASNTLTYTITITNLMGSALDDLFVTNEFSAPVQFGTPLASQSANFFTNTDGTVVFFQFGPFADGTLIQITLPVTPLTAGLLTNTTFVASGYTTVTASTNVITQVTNSTTVVANIGVTMTGPAQVVITNDWMTYGVTLTNLGSNDATGITLTNTLPPDAIFKGVAPNYSHQTIAGTNLVFDLGTLPAGSYTNLQFTVEPTNAGVQTFSASVGNHSASTNITVINYLPGILVAVTNSAQILNYQNLLEEQSILLSNVGPNDVTSARVVVSGLTGFNKQLFNAFGTNNGDPFVVYAATLPKGKSVSLLLQYAPRPSFPLTNGQLHAFAVPPPNLIPPASFATSTNFNITRIIKLANDNMLVEFPSTLGRTYTVVYSDNVLFSNAMIAPPSIVAPANETFWYDYGPPETVSAPTNSGSRYYRVFQNP